jgi:hypothetical protein
MIWFNVSVMDWEMSGAGTRRKWCHTPLGMDLVVVVELLFLGWSYGFGIL